MKKIVLDGWVLNPIPGFLREKRRRFDTQRGKAVGRRRQRLSYAATHQEILQLLAARRGKEGWFPRAFRGSVALRIP